MSYADPFRRISPSPGQFADAYDPSEVFSSDAAAVREQKQQQQHQQQQKQTQQYQPPREFKGRVNHTTATKSSGFRAAGYSSKIPVYNDLKANEAGVSLTTTTAATAAARRKVADKSTFGRDVTNVPTKIEQGRKGKTAIGLDRIRKGLGGMFGKNGGIEKQVGKELPVIPPAQMVPLKAPIKKVSTRPPAPKLSLKPSVAFQMPATDGSPTDSSAAAAMRYSSASTERTKPPTISATAVRPMSTEAQKTGSIHAASNHPRNATPRVEIVKTVRDAFAESPSKTSSALMREMSGMPHSVLPSKRHGLPYPDHLRFSAGSSVSSTWEKIEAEVEEIMDWRNKPSAPPPPPPPMMSRMRSALHLTSHDDQKASKPSGLSRMKSSLALHRRKSQKCLNDQTPATIEGLPPHSQDDHRTIKTKKSSLWNMLRGGKTSSASDDTVKKTTSYLAPAFTMQTKRTGSTTTVNSGLSAANSSPFSSPLSATRASPGSSHVLVTSRSYLVQETRAPGASPKLPIFHFSRPSYASSNFGTEGFLSRFGYGVDGEEEETGNTLPLPQPRDFARKTSSVLAHGGGGSSTRPFAGIWDEESLDQVEADIGDTPSPSPPAKVLKIMAAEKSPAALPKRKSLLGLFAEPVATKQSASTSGRQTRELLRKRASGKDNLMKQVTPKANRKPSIVDINKVSTATEDLLRLVSHGDICDTPSTWSSSLPTSVGPSPHGMMSAGDISTVSGDSPTPMRNLQHLKTGHPVSLLSSRISPLRLAVNPSFLTRHRNTGVRDGSPDSNPFVATPLKSARDRNDEETVGMRSCSKRSKTFENHVETSDASMREVSEDVEVVSGSEDEDELPVSKPAELSLDLGPSVDRISMLSVLPESTGPEEQPRSSFDFTGEFNMLSEEGNRQSFVEQMAKFGLINPADISTASETTIAGGNHHRQESSGSSIFTKTSPFRGRLNPGFQFGNSRAARLVSPSAFGSIKKHAPTSFAKPGAGRGTHDFHRPNPSVFSFGSISSVGDIVSTGIAGTHFQSVFDLELTLSVKQSLGLPLPPNRPQAKGVPASSPRRVLWKASSVARARQISITAAMSMRLPESPHGPSKLGHTRQNSSIDSNRSSAQRIGRPGCDVDRMFITEGQLASITQSPHRVASYDSIMDSSKLTLDSIMDTSSSNSTDFFGGSATSQVQLFRIKSARRISGISCMSSDSSNADAVVGGTLDTWVREGVEHGSPLADRRSKMLDGKAKEAVNSVVLSGNGEDDSVNVASVALSRPGPTSRSGNSRTRVRPPRSHNSRHGPIALKYKPLSSPPVSLDNRLTIDVGAAQQRPPSKPISRLRIEQSSSSPRSSLDLLHTPQLSSVHDSDTDSLATSSNVRVGTPGFDWEQWGQNARHLCWQSKDGFPDSEASLAAIAGFTPPSSSSDLIDFLNDSSDLYVSLAESSPRRQVSARTHREAEGLLPLPLKEESTTRKASLPTKFQRIDSSSTVSSAMSSTFGLGGEDEDTMTPVSALFARFAVSVAVPQLVSSSPTKRTTLAKKASQEMKRQRLTSSVRRQKLGRTKKRVDDAPAAGAVAPSFKEDDKENKSGSFVGMTMASPKPRPRPASRARPAQTMRV